MSSIRNRKRIVRSSKIYLVTKQNGDNFFAPSGGKVNLPLLGVAQSLALWARIFTAFDNIRRIA
jgi:hypothetical protein